MDGASSYRRFRDDGDEQGLVEIIQTYKDGLMLYLNSFVGNIAVAEELTEDTFVLLGTKRPKDTGKSSFKTWLYTIGRHVAIDYLRRRAKRQEIYIEDSPALRVETENLEAQYIRQEQRAVVRHAIAKLKPEYRQALWLVYYEDFTHKQVATVMNKSVHNVEMLIYRAKKALKTQFETEGFMYEEL